MPSILRRCLVASIFIAYHFYFNCVLPGVANNKTPALAVGRNHRLFHSSSSTKNAAKTHIYWIWAVDADVPSEAALMLKSIVSEETVEILHAYCGNCWTRVFDLGPILLH